MASTFPTRTEGATRWGSASDLVPPATENTFNHVFVQLCL